MKTQWTHRLVGFLSCVLVLGWTGLVSAQTFSSGSTGANGAFNPSCAPTPCTVTVALPASGIFNYTTVNVPSGVTVKFTPDLANTPVTMLATGNVTITGTIDVSGTAGAFPSSSGPLFNPGVAGGPGGFNGGDGGARGGGLPAPLRGTGPGGGSLPTAGSPAPSGTYGAQTSFVSLVPLFGGSGGAGGNSSATLSGGAGGGGGGAIVIASSTQITLTSPGSIVARGGEGGGHFAFPGTCVQAGGAGSGGAIRLVAPTVAGNGSIRAEAVAADGCANLGSDGRVRLEAFTLNHTFSILPAASQSLVPGPVTPASTPPLVNFPALVITSVGGVAMPANPSGAHTVADLTLPVGTVNPVPVVVTATSTPVPTTFTLQLVPQHDVAISLQTAVTSGTFANSTATANVTFPSGQTSVLIVYGNFTVPVQVASLFPLIDGESVEQIMLAAMYGERSTMTLVTRSGKEMPVARLSPGDQLRVALAWEAMQTSQ